MTLVRAIRDIAHQFASGTAPSFAFLRVAPPASVAQAAPPFLLGPASATNLFDIFGDIDVPGAGCYVIENTLVAPTGFAIKDGVALHGTPFIHPRHHVVTVSDRLNTECVPTRHLPGPLAVICGPAHETWGHWLADFMPRLWVLQAAGYVLADLRFLVPPDLRPFAWELLAGLGIARAQCDIYRHWAEIIRTDLLLLPTGLRHGNRFAPCFYAATKWWTEAIKHNLGVSAGDDERVFVSRGGASQDRHMANRVEIEGIAQQAGWTLVRPEENTIARQIAIFSGARVVAGEYGSALHNSVFGRPGTLVCGLRGTSKHPSFLQSGIATALGQRAGYVFGNTAGQDVTQRFVIAPGLFAKALDIIEAGRTEAVLF